MFLQTLGAEELLADGVFSIPRGRGWVSSEDAKDREDQVGLSSAAARILSRAPLLNEERDAGIVVRPPAYRSRIRFQVGGEGVGQERLGGTTMALNYHCRTLGLRTNRQERLGDQKSSRSKSENKSA